MRLYSRNGILYVYSNGVRKSSGLKDTKENRKLLKSFHNNDIFYERFNIKSKNKSVLDFCDEVLETKSNHLQPTTMHSYFSLFNSRIVPFFKGKLVDEVTPIMLKEFYSTFNDKSTLNT